MPPRWAGRAGKPQSLDDNKARLTGSIRVFPRYVKLPRLGKLRPKEPTDKLLRLLEAGKAKILSATISREADRWFVSLTCEVERPEVLARPVREPDDVVGVDLGLCAWTRLEAPKPLKKASGGQNSFPGSRKAPRTTVRLPCAAQLRRLHRRIRNIRRDFLHKVTTEQPPSAAPAKPATK